MPFIIPNLFDFTMGRQAALASQSTRLANRGSQIENFQNFLTLTRDRQSFNDDTQYRALYNDARQSGLSPTQANLAAFTNATSPFAANAGLGNFAAQQQLGLGPGLAASNLGDNSLLQQLFGAGVPATGRVDPAVLAPAANGGLQAMLDMQQRASTLQLMQQLTPNQNLASVLANSQANAAQGREAAARIGIPDTNTLNLLNNMMQFQRSVVNPDNLIPQSLNSAPNQTSTRAIRDGVSALPTSITINPTTNPGQSAFATAARSQTQDFGSSRTASSNPQLQSNPFALLGRASPFGPAFGMFG